MTFFNLGSTKSGVPGNARLCNRNRNPSEWTTLRTISSGLESFPLTRAMSAERFVGTSSNFNAFAPGALVGIEIDRQ